MVVKQGIFNVPHHSFNNAIISLKNHRFGTYAVKFHQKKMEMWSSCQLISKLIS